MITVGAADIDGSVSTQRRLRRTVVGLRLHARRLRQARPRARRAGTWSARARRFDARHGAADERRRPRLHGALRHLVRGSGRRRRRRPDPRARIPTWTPDQVKGALMVSAQDRPAHPAPLSAGVGVVDVAKAVALSSAPNPNAALNKFVAHRRLGGTGPCSTRPAGPARRSDQRVLGERLVGGCLLGLRVLGPGQLGERLLGLRLLGLRLLGERLAVGRLVGERVLGIRLLVGQRRGRGAVRGGRVPERRRARGVRADPAIVDPADTTLRRFRDARALSQNRLQAGTHPFGGISRVRASLKRGTLAHFSRSYLAAMALRPHAYAWNGASFDAWRPLE